MRGMNILLSIAITTGILSGIWGWVAVSLGLLSWAGFLGCTAYFACPQGGLKGLWISACTVYGQTYLPLINPLEEGAAFALLGLTIFYRVSRRYFPLQLSVCRP